MEQSRETLKLSHVTDLTRTFMAKTVMTGTGGLVQPRFSYFNVTSVIAAKSVFRSKSTPKDNHV